jgi:hypothetical protein
MSVYTYIGRFFRFRASATDVINKKERRKTMRSITLFSLVSFAILSIVVYQVNAQMSWQAERFTSQSGDAIQILKPPLDTAGSLGNAYQITEASGGAFIGTPNGGAGNAGSWVKYEFTVSKGGDWYFWGRAISTSDADDSFYWMLDGADADAAANADTDKTNIWDFNELDNCPLGTCLVFPTDWLWFRLSARAAGPFSVGPTGQGIDYANPIPLSLTAGKHTLHIIGREDGTFLDVIFATMDKVFDANQTSPETAVEPQAKLTTTWGQLKQAH